jgi:hypothetical protein
MTGDHSRRSGGTEATAATLAMAGIALPSGVKQLDR